MTKTFHEISEAIDNTDLDPFAKDAFGFLTEAFAIDESYDTEAEAVEDMIDTLYQDKSNLISIIEAVTDLQTWVVVLRMDGAATLVLTREVLASSDALAADKFVTDLVGTGHVSKQSLTLEAVYGPY